MNEVERRMSDPEHGFLHDACELWQPTADAARMARRIPLTCTILDGCTSIRRVPVTCETSRKYRKNKRAFILITRYRDTTRNMHNEQRSH